MGISPVSELLVTPEVFSSHIETAHKSDTSVYDHDFPVVTVIYTQLKLSEKCREELSHLNSFIFQTLPVLILHCTAAHTVEKYPDRHSLSRFLNKDFLNLLPQFIIPDDVILQMDIFFCLPHLLDKGAKFYFTISIYPDVIIVCKDGLTRFKIIQYQILETRHLGICEPQTFMIDRLFLPPHGIFQFSLNLLRFEHTALVKVLSDDQIKDKTEYRYKIKQKKPCPYRLRRSPLKEHDNQREEDINDDDVVHNKIIDRHRSVPNHFCHKSNSFVCVRGCRNGLSVPARRHYYNSILVFPVKSKP